MRYRTTLQIRPLRAGKRLCSWVAVWSLAASFASAVCAQQLGALGAIDKEVAKVDREKGKASENKIDPTELVKTIAALEERLKQLEAKLAGLDDGPGKNLPSATEITEIKKEVAAIQEETKKNASFLNFFRDVEVSGIVDGYYSYNFNHPENNFNLGRNFDFRHNSFNLNLAKITFEKKNDVKDRLGFRLDVGFGPTMDWVHAADPTGGEVVKHIQQAYLSYVAPVGSGLTLDFGKFVTVHGAEVIETKDNFNYSRSLLFSYAIPYYHMGLRARYSFNDKVAMTGLLVNGWDNFTDNNGGKTLGVGVGLTITKRLSIVQNYMAGPEQPEDDRKWRHLSDTTVSYLASDKLTLMGNFDYGKQTLSDGLSGHWKGFAAYLRYAFTNKLAFAPRFEVFDDHDGFRTGLRQRLKEVTLTQELKLATNLLARVEFRRDFSDQEFFNKSFGRTVRSQNTLLVGFSYFFSSRGQ
jgi:hypothetical protein